MVRCNRFVLGHQGPHAEPRNKGSLEVYLKNTFYLAVALDRSHLGQRVPDCFIASNSAAHNPYGPYRIPAPAREYFDSKKVSI